jgi:hypothetical protein
MRREELFQADMRTELANFPERNTKGLYIKL